MLDKQLDQSSGDDRDPGHRTKAKGGDVSYDVRGRPVSPDQVSPQVQPLLLQRLGARPPPFDLVESSRGPSRAVARPSPPPAAIAQANPLRTARRPGHRWASARPSTPCSPRL